MFIFLMTVSTLLSISFSAKGDPGGLIFSAMIVIVAYVIVVMELRRRLGFYGK